MPEILYLCPHCPFGEAYGAALRARTTLEGLRRAGRVTLVPIGPHAWSAEAARRAAGVCEVTRPVAYIHTPPSTARKVDRNFNTRTLATDDRAVSSADEAMILQRAAASDMTWIHTVSAANAVGRWKWPRTVLDADDLLSQYHAARAASETGIERLRARWQSRLWRRRERRYAERFTRTVVCSSADQERLGAANAAVIPNTFDDDGIVQDRSPAAKPRFGFVATFEYAPNRDAARWFAKGILPLIRRAHPDAELRLVGKGGPAFAAAEGIVGGGCEALGYVDDPSSEMATWTAMVVPVRFGGGTRVKIAEAFARRLPVVSTRLGAFGYDLHDGREALLADDATSFADACLSLAGQPGLGDALAAQGHEYFRERISPAMVREQVCRVAQAVMAGAASGGGAA